MIEKSIANILPKEISGIISKRLELGKLYELRFRTGRPVGVNYGGKHFYLSPQGLTESAANCYVCGAVLLSDIVARASEYSLYAVNDKLCGGFLTILGGIRIGIAGETVIENGSVKTVKNFNAINIRIPHEVKGCGVKVFDSVCVPTVKNTLIVSPPGAGKTTLLRDLTRLLGLKQPHLNVLLVDERNEIAACRDGACTLDVGSSTDVISGSGKEFAFMQGVRAMRPDVIVTDELYGEKDAAAVEHLCSCGVRVLASIHADGVEDLRIKPGFERLIIKKLFKRFVCLSAIHGPGGVEGIYNADLERVYG